MKPFPFMNSLIPYALLVLGPFHEKLCPFYYTLYKMEKVLTVRMPELKALTREHRLRCYSQLRKAELIELIQNNQQPLRSGTPGALGPVEPNCPPRPNRPPPDQSATQT